MYVLVSKWHTVLIDEQCWVFIAQLVEGRVDELEVDDLFGIIRAANPPMIQVELKVVGDIEILCGAGWRNSTSNETFFCLSLILSSQLELDELALLLTCLACEVLVFLVPGSARHASLFARLVNLREVFDLQSACLFDIRVVHAN